MTHFFYVMLFVLIGKKECYIINHVASNILLSAAYSQSNENSIPKHIAFIVDGNGRWASEKGLDRSVGHGYGAKRSVDIVKYCFENGITTVTLFLFSTENWNRPVNEVKGIMNLLESNLIEFSDYFRENQIVVKTIGQTNRLNPQIQQLLSRLTNYSNSTDVEQKVLCLALSYGGRHDIVQACKLLAAAITENNLTVEEIDEEIFGRCTNTGRLGIPDPCLIVRTSGEQRLSNFLLWQCAYSEFSTVACLWPDFDTDRLAEVLADFSRRRRRFGCIESSGSS